MNRFAFASASSRRPDSSVRRTWSHSGAHSRSSTAVRVRNRTSFAVRPAVHSDSKYSATNLSSPPPLPADRPSSVRAARQVPAGQPSIRRLRVASPGDSTSAPRFRSRSSSSRWLSASSAAPSSKRRPAARARATAKPTVRPASTTVEPAGTCLARAATRVSEPRERSRCASSRTSRTGRSRASSVEGRAPWERRPSARPRDARSTRGSLSASARVSQAHGLESRAVHCARSVVLP